MSEEAKVRKPSPAQREVLEKMHENGSFLYRWPGGRWFCQAYVKGTTPTDPWFTDSSTLWAIEMCEWVRRFNEHDEDWKDTRIITAAGIEAIGRIAYHTDMETEA